MAHQISRFEGTVIPEDAPLHEHETLSAGVPDQELITGDNERIPNGLSPHAVANGVSRIRERNTAPEEHRPDFYERIVVPANDSHMRYDIPIEVVGDTLVRINSFVVALTGHKLFIFNALMMLRRDQERIRQADVVRRGFHPEGSTGAQKRAFVRGIQDLMILINAAAGEPVIQQHSKRGGSCYSVSPSFGFDEASRAISKKKSFDRLNIEEVTRPGADDEEVIEDAEASARKDRIAEMLIRKYGQHPEVARLVNRYKDPKARPIKAELQHYSQKAAQYKLLNAQEEVILGQRLRRGFEAVNAMIAENRVIPTAEEKELFLKFVAAHQVFCNCNLRLVMNIANRYTYAHSGGMDTSDLITEGNMGLITAVRRFDERKGFKFSTYATWWIRQNITRAIANKVRAIRLPVPIHERAQKMRKFVDEYEQEHEERPTNRQIAEHLDRPEADIELLQRFGRLEMDSLDMPVLEDGKTTRGELTADPSLDSDIEYQMDIMSDQVELEGLLRQAKLSPRELVLLGYRYGVEIPAIIEARTELARQGYDLTLSQEVNATPVGDSDLSYDAIGKMLGLNRAQVKKLEDKTLNKIFQKARAEHISQRALLS